jgi:general secretion pathway protein G
MKNVVCRRSFTLVEMLVVVTIIALIAGLVLPNVMGGLEKSKRDTAKAQIKVLDDAVLSYYLDMKEHPRTLNDLVKSSGSSAKWNGPYLKSAAIPKDPWGNEYYFDHPGQDGRGYDIYSYGRDGASGGQKNDADIGSWYDE